MTSVMEVVAARTISLLTVDVKTRKLTVVSREMMEEALKTLNIGAKILSRRSSMMWDILLASEEAAKALAGSTLTTKMLRLQTKYMGTWKTCITLHRVPMYITEDHLGAFFSSFGPVEGLILIKGKSGIATSDFEVLVTLTRPKFNNVPNVITCVGRNIYIIVEG